MKVQIFLSYADKDKEGALTFKKNCASFFHSDKLCFYEEGEKHPLTLSAQTRQKIEKAHIFIALFTQDYVYNGACRDALYLALQRHLARHLDILPIAWKDCHWTSIDGAIQRLVLPKDKRAVTYTDGWKPHPQEPWNQIFNRLSLYLQKAQSLPDNADIPEISAPLLKTPLEKTAPLPRLRPANDAMGIVPLQISEEKRQFFIQESLQKISWIFQKRLLEFQEKSPQYTLKIEIISPVLSRISASLEGKRPVLASLALASRSDPLSVKMGNALPPSLLCYYAGTLEDKSFAVSMGEFLLTDKGRMIISPIPSCILEIVEGPSCLGWGRSKKQRADLRSKLSIAERPSKNGFDPEQVANIFWGFFMAQAESKRIKN